LTTQIAQHNSSKTSPFRAGFAMGANGKYLATVSAEMCKTSRINKKIA